MSGELINVCEVIMDKSLRVKQKESVLIVTDSLQDPEINDALMTSAIRKGAEAGILVMMPRKAGKVEAPTYVAEAMKACNVVLLTPIRTITYSRAVREARKSGARVLGLPGITRDIMLRAISVDYEEMRERASSVAEAFRKARVVSVTSSEGDKLRLELTPQREPLVGDGICELPGEMDWLPAGFVSMAPIEGTAEGVFVANGSCNYFGILQEPIKLTVKRGLVTDIRGGAQADRYRKLLEELKDPNSFNIGEIGIGLNQNAKLTGVTVEDERIIAGVTLGVGQNILHGGRTDAKVHVDLTSLNATVQFDQRTIAENGKLGI